MNICPHACCPSIIAARTNPKKQERKHTHVHAPDDCPSCYVAGHRLSKGRS